jgi:hypothetical protein
MFDAKFDDVGGQSQTYIVEGSRDNMYIDWRVQSTAHTYIPTLIRSEIIT